MELEGKIALVTGASRGLGKGIALVLAETGATVYLTGRSEREGDGPEGLPGSIQSTAREIEAKGGKAIGLRCDHRDDDQTRQVFDAISERDGRLDILVNNVWGGYENLTIDGRYIDSLPFWQQPIRRWDSMFAAGVRAHYVASVLAAPIMVAQEVA